MKQFKTVFVFCTCIALASCKKEQVPIDKVNDTEGAASFRKPGPTATVSTLATGFNNPRGLKFGPDGNLYVAEAGTGGTTSTASICPLRQIHPPFGPALGSPNGGRVSMVTMQGSRTTVSDQLPSSTSAIEDIMGPSDVAFMGNTLYVLLAGAGCSHGVTSLPNGIVRLNASGPPTVIADLGTWSFTHPVVHPEPFDFEPEGVWYSMTVVGNEFYALEPNHGELVKVDLNGNIQRVIDISASQGHIVPTALAYRGNFYVGNLGTFPINPTSSVFKITPDGTLKQVATGFSTILGLVVDKTSNMYVLEMSPGAPFPDIGLGRIRKVNPNGTVEEVVSGLNFPTAMTMGPDGNLYVSEWGFGMGPGGGRITKVTL